MKDFLEMIIAASVLIGAGLVGGLIIMACTPWFWLAVIAYILATNL